ncbi:MAG TPA: hypothetical protein VMZ92_00720 [Planctomycetota bacterium]|nr:hypothetical protein [Planctomycetota bacterium]
MARRRVLMPAVLVLCVATVGCGARERERLQAQLAKADVEREVLRAQVQKVDKDIQTLQAKLTHINAENEGLRAQVNVLATELNGLKAKHAGVLQERDKWRMVADEAKVTIAKKDAEIQERDAAIKEIRDFLARSDQKSETLRKELEREKNTWWLDKFFKDLFPPPAPPPEP